MKLRPLTESEVTFHEDCEADEVPSWELHRDDVADILRRLHEGDNTAWCVLVVRARWKGFSGYASLGEYVFPEGNTGDDNAVFAREDYALLRAQALENLNQNIAQRAAEVAELVAA